MRRIEREALSEPTLRKLRGITATITSAADPKKAAASKWNSATNNQAFREIRATLEGMASGRSRCMYCEDGTGTDIEHFWPKADYPERAFTWDNYLLACSYCNSNLKRNQFPLDANDEPLLIDPTVDEPAEHLLFLPSSGRFRERSAKGKASIEVFGLNDDTTPRQLPTGRMDTLVNLAALLIRYDQLAASEPKEAERFRQSAVRHPFSAVFHWMMAVALGPNGKAVLGRQLVDIIERHNVET